MRRSCSQLQVARSPRRLQLGGATPLSSRALPSSSSVRATRDVWGVFIHKTYGPSPLAGVAMVPISDPWGWAPITGSFLIPEVGAFGRAAVGRTSGSRQMICPLALAGPALLRRQLQRQRGSEQEAPPPKIVPLRRSLRATNSPTICFLLRSQEGSSASTSQPVRQGSCALR